MLKNAFKQFTSFFMKLYVKYNSLSLSAILSKAMDYAYKMERFVKIETFK